MKVNVVGSRLFIQFIAKNVSTQITGVTLHERHIVVRSEVDSIDLLRRIESVRFQNMTSGSSSTMVVDSML